MLRRLREWIDDRKRQRAEREQIDIMREVWGPWRHQDIDLWDHRKLTEMIASGEMPPDGRAYAESRLRILEQELGPAGRSARMAKFALLVSIGSLIVAGFALAQSM